MLTALISPWTGQAWNGRPHVSVLASASMCTAQHYQLLFRQSQLINRRAEMHLNWFIWLVLDVFLFLVETTCASLRGGWVCVPGCVLMCVCVYVGWQMFFQPNHENTSPTSELRWSQYLRPYQQILYTFWINSFLQRRDILGTLG